jgi:hypothetical protein
LEQRYDAHRGYQMGRIHFLCQRVVGQGVMHGMVPEPRDSIETVFVYFQHLLI